MSSHASERVQKKDIVFRQMDSDTNLVLRPDLVLIMVDRQIQPSSADIQKMQFMRVTNIHHSEIFRL